MRSTGLLVVVVVVVVVLVWPGECFPDPAFYLVDTKDGPSSRSEPGPPPSPPPAQSGSKFYLINTKDGGAHGNLHSYSSCSDCLQEIVDNLNLKQGLLKLVWFFNNFLSVKYFYLLLRYLTFKTKDVVHLNIFLVKP